MLYLCPQPRPPQGSMCDIPQALWTALKLGEGKKLMETTVLIGITVLWGRESPSVYKCLTDLEKKKKILINNLTSIDLIS